MRVFITGASGYVGSVVTEKALAAGHTLVGLARSDASAAKLEAMGASVVRGTLEDLGVLAAAAKDADAVLHLGFVHDFSRPYDELLAIDIKAIDAMAGALAGTGKPLVMTSGTAVVQSQGEVTTEETPPIKNSLSARVKAEDAAIKHAANGVRPVAIRLAPYVYGRGGSYFVPINMEAAAKAGHAFYVGDGEQMTTTADVDAAADLYLLAMDKAKAGSVYNCSTEYGVRIKDMAQAIGKALGVEVKSVSADESTKLCGPFVSMFLQMSNRASNEKAMKELGWKPVPKHAMLDDIVSGSYKPYAEELKAKYLKSGVM